MKYLKSGIVVALASLASAAYAQGGSGPLVTEPTNVITSATDITNLFCTILVWMFWGLITLSIAMGLVGAYLYATAGDRPEQVSKANKTLLYAAIAIVVAIMAQAIPTLVGGFLGVQSGLSVCS